MATIERIVVKVNDKEFSLSLAEAKELQQILDSTFGTSEKSVPYPVYIERQSPVLPVHPWRYWEVWCAGNSTMSIHSRTYK